MTLMPDAGTDTHTKQAPLARRRTNKPGLRRRIAPQRENEGETKQTPVAWAALLSERAALSDRSATMTGRLISGGGWIATFAGGWANREILFRCRRPSGG